MSTAPDGTGRRERDGRRRVLAGWLAGAACGLALLGSTAISVKDMNYGDAGFRRFRTDQAVAITVSLRQRYPESPPGLGGAPWDPDIDLYYHSALDRQVRVEGIQPWQVWRLVRDRPFLRANGPDRVPSYDDPGRGWLLQIGFRLLGGISPFLILWLGPGAMALALTWFVWESAQAGRVVAGLVFALLLAASPYAVETLALTRSAVGFHLVAPVLLLALALVALRTPAPSWSVWLARSAVAGLGFAVCALCRSGVLTMLPAFLAVLVWGSARAGTPDVAPRRRVAGLLAATALLIVPFLALRPAQRHDTWAGLWQGLGDYDRSKGHVWSDRAAAEAVWRAEGRARKPPRHGGDALVASNARPEAVALLRREFLEHIRADPAWYAGIVARRALATVSLERLWPWTPRDGYGVSEFEIPGGGKSLMNKYWGFTANADWLGVGSLRSELPVSVLWAPTALLLLWCARPGRPRGARNDGPPLVLGVLALAVLALPVLVTTASGTEPQAFVLVLYLGCGYLLDELTRAVRHRRAAAAQDPGPARGEVLHPRRSAG